MFDTPVMVWLFCLPEPAFTFWEWGMRRTTSISSSTTGVSAITVIHGDKAWNLARAEIDSWKGSFAVEAMPIRHHYAKRHKRQGCDEPG